MTAWKTIAKTRSLELSAKLKRAGVSELPTFFTWRQPQIAFIVLLTSLVICSLLISFYKNTRLDIYLVSSVYIAFAYCLFTVLLAVKIIRRRKSQALNQSKISIPLFNTALTLVLASCLLMVLENMPQYRLLYNSAALLGYAVLLFYSVSYVAQ